MSQQIEDDCSAALYRRLPYQNELECVRKALPFGATVLELGCGTGRLTRKLLEWGLDVTAVDYSSEMLDDVPDSATKVLSDIESLALDQTFDIVLLASHLINNQSEVICGRYVSTCARHIHADGVVIIERFPPNFLATAQVGKMGESGAISIFVDAVERSGSVVNMTLRYVDGEINWIHRFSAEHLNESTLYQLLSVHGLQFARWHDLNKQWFSAKCSIKNSRH